MDSSGIRRFTPNLTATLILLAAAFNLLVDPPSTVAKPLPERHKAASLPPATTFDIRSGTSFTLAVSPDGKQLAIDLQGSIWIMAAKGGRARRITDRFDDAHMPSWSPDGTRIAYYAYRDGSYKIWSIGVDGTDARSLTEGEFDDREPAWSPDGKAIAFASERDGGYDIWTIDVASKKLTQLTRAPSEDRAPTWSRDGRTIVFSSTKGAQSSILEVPVSGGEAQILRTAPSGATYEGPSLSPDRQLYYVAHDAAGSRVETNGRPVSGAESVFPFRGVWFGDSFYYVSDGLIRCRSKTKSRTVPFVAELEASRSSYHQVKRDFTSTLPRKVLGIQHPVISPDGTKIAFVALGDLYIVASSGGKPNQFTQDSALEADPSWSPDGKTIAYTSDKGGGLPQLWLRDLATSADRRLTNLATQPRGSAWSPDGGRIAFLDYDGFFGTAGLMVVEVSTGVVTRLQNTLPQPGNPTWSSDGRYVAVGLSRPFSASAREGSNQIWVVPSNGRDVPFWRNATDRSLDTRGGGGPVWSPDGTKMAAIQDGLLKVWPVGPDGTALGKPRTYSDEISHFPTWSGDSRSILFQAADKLKIADLATGVSREVSLDFSYRLAMPKERLVIHVGALIDAVHDATQKDLDLIIVGNRIDAIRPHDATNYKGADKVIEAPELTAIPGLIDFHAHSQKDFGENAHLAWLAYGITTVRDPGNQPYDGVEDREASEAGVRIGPRIYTTGPLLEWKRVFYRMGVAVSGPEHLEREITRAGALKYDLIKSYVRMPDLEQLRLVEAAHAMGIPVATHEIYPAIFSGVDNVEHLAGTSRRGFSPKQDSEGWTYDDVVGLFGHSSTTLTPTNFGALNIYFARHPELRKDPRLALYPSWASTPFTLDHPLPASLLAMQTGQLSAIKAIHDAGGKIVAGTDLVIAPNLLGELTSYVDAGLTPFEALQTATVNPARALNLDAGTLEPGQLADIALVSGDPRLDIGALFRVRQIISNGRPFTVEELLKLGATRK